VEENASYRIEVAAPGVSRKDFHIEVENDVLTISSEQKENKEEKNRRFMRREFSYNSFKRSFQLPESIDQGNIKASHEAGILIIELPKKDEVVQKAARQIEVK
jgi:HSP20 family protein